MHYCLIGKPEHDYGGIMNKIAIYDMDKTITRKATFGPFLTYAVPRHAPWRVAMLPLVALVTLGYGMKLIDRGRLKEINLSLLLGRKIEAEQLDALSRGFAERTLASNMLQRAIDQIEADRAEGYRIVIASASYAFYVREIARQLNIADVIATRTIHDARHVTPRIDGENCYGAAKRAMVEAWLAEQGIGAADIRFYSDHISDAPCFEMAQQGFATNPHPPLRRSAPERGWTVLDWQ